MAAEPAEDWWAIVYPPRPTHETNADAVILLAAVDRVAAQDAASQLARQERQRDITERDKLNEFRLLPKPSAVDIRAAHSLSSILISPDKRRYRNDRLLELD